MSFIITALVGTLFFFQTIAVTHARPSVRSLQSQAHNEEVMRRNVYPTTHLKKLVFDAKDFELSLQYPATWNLERFPKNKIDKIILINKIAPNSFITISVDTIVGDIAYHDLAKLFYEDPLYANKTIYPRVGHLNISSHNITNNTKSYFSPSSVELISAKLLGGKRLIEHAIKIKILDKIYTFKYKSIASNFGRDKEVFKNLMNSLVVYWSEEEK